MNSIGLHPALFEGLHLVDSPLLVSRYNQALALITGRETRLTRFHVDAMGYSPEVAHERDEADYLGQGRDRPFCIIVTLAQVTARVIHPNAGFACAPFFDALRDFRSELAILTVYEPVFAALEHDCRRLDEPRHLARVRSVRISFETPSGRVGASRELQRAGEEFLESHRWNDDDVIGYMLGLSRVARRLRVPPTFGQARPVTWYFTPHFGGSYVFRRGDDAKRCWVLSRGFAVSNTSWMGDQRVIGVPLEPGAVVEFLQKRGLATNDPAECGRSEMLRRKMQWVALSSLLEEIGDAEQRHLARLSPDDLDARMQSHPRPPGSYLELEEARHGASARRLGTFSPLTQLRLLSPVENGARRFTRHLLATLDPIDLEQLYRDAPDVFFARYSALPASLRGVYAEMLKSRKVVPSCSSSTSASGSLRISS